MFPAIAGPGQRAVVARYRTPADILPARFLVIESDSRDDRCIETGDDAGRDAVCTGFFIYDNHIVMVQLQQRQIDLERRGEGVAARVTV